MRGLEVGRIVPGQRLVETELALQFEVGRNAVREAIQWLSAQNIVDASRHRSPAIRILRAREALQLLDVAEALFCLAARAAAARCATEPHPARLAAIDDELDAAMRSETPGAFARARRHFHASLLDVAGNTELQRLFPALGLGVLQAQFANGPSRDAQARIRAIIGAVTSGNPAAAEAAVREYIDVLRAGIA